MILLISGAKNSGNFCFFRQLTNSSLMTYNATARRLLLVLCLLPRLSGCLHNSHLKEGMDTKASATFKVILTALFAALICIATMLVQIPIPATGGYANLGDGVILICAFLLHPACAVAAAGLGSMLADLLAGYIAYAPGTLVIKAGVALITCMIFRVFSSKSSAGFSLFSIIVSSLLAETFMIIGYFFYEAVILGLGMGAAAGVLGNAGQAVVGAVIACTLSPALLRLENLKKWMK